MKNLSKEVEEAKLTDPDILEEINTPNPGFEIGLQEFDTNDVEQFKNFYDDQSIKHINIFHQLFLYYHN